MVGNCSHVLQKSKYQGLFNGIFVSSRYAQILGEPYFRGLLNTSYGRGFVAAETAKFIIPLNQDTKSEFQKKLEEFAQVAGYEKLEGKSFPKFFLISLSMGFDRSSCFSTTPG